MGMDHRSRILFSGKLGGGQEDQRREMCKKKRDDLDR